MKKTTHYISHRWTNEEIKKLMEMWDEGTELIQIANNLNVTQNALLRMIQRLRKGGVPLKRRKKGHIAGRANTLWSQAEIEYLIRRRKEVATAEEIGMQLGRTPGAVQGMVDKLRTEGVHIPMLGSGVRRLWDVNVIKGVFNELEASKIVDINERASQ